MGKSLAEDLMSMLASLRNAYATATWNHPDDSVRILTLDASEALIMRARRELYGEMPDADRSSEMNES